MSRTPQDAQARKRHKAPGMSAAEFSEQMHAITRAEDDLYRQRGIPPARPCGCTPTSHPADCSHSLSGQRCPCWCHGEHFVFTTTLPSSRGAIVTTTGEEEDLSGRARAVFRSEASR